MSHGTPAIPVLIAPGIGSIYGLNVKSFVADPILTEAVRTSVIQGTALHYVDDGRADEIAKRADSYFGDDFVPSSISFLQAFLRELWKDENGTYSRWDRVAHRAGVFSVGRVILSR